MSANELTRGSSETSGKVRAWCVNRLERLSGVHRLMHVYEQWRNDVAGSYPQKMNELLRMLDTRLDISGVPWPPQIAQDKPLVMIANHPFGIGDGIAFAAMAEKLERRYKVLINTEFERIDAFRDHCLPIDFGNTKEAMRTNLETRKSALRALKGGETLLVFPAGTVATAPFVFGRAQEVPWKTFTAGLVQKAQANVLPVFFEGQNSFLFHAASHINASLRMSLLIAEFRRFPKSSLKIRVGALKHFEDFAHGDDRQRLTDELFLCVHHLAPWATGLPDEKILPAEKMRKRPYKWDLPLGNN